jgi:hypothetical protein
MDSDPRVRSSDSLGIVEIKMNGLDLMKMKGYERSNPGHRSQDERWPMVAWPLLAALRVPSAPVHYSQWFLAPIEDKVMVILTLGRTQLGRRQLGRATTGRLLLNGTVAVAHSDHRLTSKLSPRDSLRGPLPPPMLQLWWAAANWLWAIAARVLGLSILWDEIQMI